MGAERGTSPRLGKKRNQKELGEPAGLIEGEGRRSVLQRMASRSWSCQRAESWVARPSPRQTPEGARQAGLPSTPSPRHCPTSSWPGAAPVAQLALSRFPDRPMCKHPHRCDHPPPVRPPKVTLCPGADTAWQQLQAESDPSPWGSQITATILT